MLQLLNLFQPKTLTANTELWLSNLDSVRGKNSHLSKTSLQSYSHFSFLGGKIRILFVWQKFNTLTSFLTDDPYFFYPVLSFSILFLLYSFPNYFFLIHYIFYLLVFTFCLSYYLECKLQCQRSLSVFVNWCIPNT